MTALLTEARLTDLQIQGAVQAALAHHAQVPYERIAAFVEDGVVTLTGTVDWRYQQSAALAATRHVGGVHDVKNELRVTFD
jgi:osmotically-inducible protein OsmY